MGGAVYAAEIDFNSLCELADSSKHYTKLAKYPAVERDIAVVVGEDVLAGDVEDVIKSAGGKLLCDIKLFDIYRGEQVEKGKKSMAYAVTLRADDRTLQDEEITKIMSKIIKSLEHRLGAALRDN